MFYDRNPKSLRTVPRVFPAGRDSGIPAEIPGNAGEDSGRIPGVWGRGPGTSKSIVFNRFLKDFETAV